MSLGLAFSRRGQVAQDAELVGRSQRTAHSLPEMRRLMPSFHPFELCKSATPEVAGGCEVLRIGPPRPSWTLSPAPDKDHLSQLDGSLVHELFNTKGTKFAANT